MFRVFSKQIIFAYFFIILFINNYIDKLNSVLSSNILFLKQLWLLASSMRHGYRSSHSDFTFFLVHILNCFLFSSLVKELATYQVQYEMKTTNSISNNNSSPDLCELCHQNKLIRNRICKFCGDRLCNNCSFSTGSAQVSLGFTLFKWLVLNLLWSLTKSHWVYLQNIYNLWTWNCYSQLDRL